MLSLGRECQILGHTASVGELFEGMGENTHVGMRDQNLSPPSLNQSNSVVLSLCSFSLEWSSFTSDLYM